MLTTRYNSRPWRLASSGPGLHTIFRHRSKGGHRMLPRVGVNLVPLPARLMLLGARLIEDLGYDSV